MNNTYRGNKWYKCDFHLHTPASNCFEDKNITPKEFVNKVVEKGLDCIAITDHNTAAWVDEIRKEAKNKNIIVFPGVEITCSDSKVHMLVLFDIDYPKDDIEYFLRDTGIKKDDFGKDVAHSKKSINEIVKIVDKCGGLVIPAHIDDYNGIYNISNDIREDFLKSIYAVQMVNEELTTICEKSNDKEIIASLEGKNLKFSQDEIKKMISCARNIKKCGTGILTFSDNPNAKGDSKHGIWGIGEKYSYIKMSENPNLESLRQAFLFPQNRIKDYFAQKNSNINLPELWIKKMIIKDIEITGKEELKIEFNPQLTTIIGGRGSGKSTIIKFLTAVFDRERIENLTEIYSEFTSFFKIKDKEGVGVLKKSTIINVEIVKNNILYKIILSDFDFADKYKNEIKYKTEIKKYNEDINDFKNIDNMHPKDIFNIEIYNQKQIYELAKNTSSLRDRIDSSIEGIKDKKEEINNLINEYKSKYLILTQTEEKINNKKKIELDLKDIEDKIGTYRASGISNIIEEYKNLKNQEILMINQEKELSNKYKKTNDCIKELKGINQDISLIKDKELLKIIEDKNLTYDDIVKELGNISERIGKLREKYIDRIKKSNWYKKYNEVKKNYEDKIESLKDKGIRIEEINNLLKSFENKQNELTIIMELEKNLEQGNKELDRIKNKYIETRREVRNSRQNYLNALLKDTNTKIEVKEFRNSDDFTKKFRDIIQKKRGFDEDINRITEKCFSGNIIKNIRNLSKKMMYINKTKVNDSEYSGKFNNVIKDLNSEQIADINMIIPEDYIEIKYKPNGSDKYKSLKNASAGQRTTAILTFILSNGNNPLILDQPEDDLDNHLIYELVIEKLKICKEKRQVIVVTHNANIPVNGDAELIIAMNSNSEYIEIYKSGGIEDEELKSEICDVMEGGKQAFSMRANRYNI